jgi:AcrR family transcriptional regulator
MKSTSSAAAARLCTLLEVALPEPRSASKRQILAEALACFNARGLEATTIDDLRRCSGQSVGTIYHHFKNKEGVVAALFFAGFDDQSRAIAARIEGQLESRGMVEALIGAYLGWITAMPEMARFLFLARESVSQGPQQRALHERLMARYAPVDACFERDARAGRVLPLPQELIPALVLGAAESYARGWLAGRRQAPPASYAAPLAEAAWRSIARLDELKAGRRPPSPRNAA